MLKTKFKLIVFAGNISGKFIELRKTIFNLKWVLTRDANLQG